MHCRCKVLCKAACIQCPERTLMIPDLHLNPLSIGIVLQFASECSVTSALMPQ